MVNKRGFLKIIEASIAIVIVISVVLILLGRQDSVKKEDLSTTISPLLKEIAENPQYRAEVLQYNIEEEDFGNTPIIDDLKTFVGESINNPYIGFDIKICSLEVICSLDSFPDTSDGNLYARERVITVSTDSSGTPRKVKIFLWRSNVNLESSRARKIAVWHVRESINVDETICSDSFLTTSISERDSPLTECPYNGYYNGEEGYVYSTSIGGAKPIYRMYSPQNNDHFYTMDINERDIASKEGYVYEGILGYSETTPGEGKVLMKRFYNLQTGDHFYTTKEELESNVLNEGYKEEPSLMYLFSNGD